MVKFHIKSKHAGVRYDCDQYDFQSAYGGKDMKSNKLGFKIIFKKNGKILKNSQKYSMINGEGICQIQ